MPLEPRKAPTRIKHKILRSYIGAWAGIIGNGVRSIVFRPGGLNSLTLDLVYLDGFAGPGLYASDADKPDSSRPVWGSPIIGLKALERAAASLAKPPRFEVRVSAILIETQQDRYDELLSNLHEAPIKTPVRRSQHFDSSLLGFATVIHDDCRNHIESILDALNGEQFLFAFLDPYGTSLPLKSLRPIVSRERTDTMILFPAWEVELHGHSSLRPLEGLQPQERENIRRNDRLFGTASWRRIAEQVDHSIEERVKHYAELYGEQLHFADPELVVKYIALKFSGLDRPIYNLFLTTRDPDGAMRMNDILHDAEIQKHWLQWKDREERLRKKEETLGIMQLDLGVPRTGPPDIVESSPTTEEVAEAVSDALYGVQSCTFKELLGRLASSPYRRSEIMRGLRRLKKSGRLTFDRLENKSDPITVKQ